MSLKLKTAKFGLLGTSHEFKQSLTWGQSAVVTGCQLLAHTLMPAPPPPLPVFSFLLPVVPPECMPKLQLSTAKSKKLIREKIEKSVNNNSCKKHVLLNAGEILYLHLHSLAIRTEMRPCTGCQSRFRLCLALLAYADRGPSGYQRKHHKSPQSSEIPSLQRHLFCSSSCTFLCSLPTFKHAALTIAKA